MNLSSTIVLNKVPEQFYRPRTAVDRSEITRCEKITIEIFPKVEEGAKLIANTIGQRSEPHRQQVASVCWVLAQAKVSHPCLKS